MRIRVANLSDLIDIFEWRNDVHSRSVFINNRIVSLEAHKEWFEYSLKNPLRRLYLGLVNNTKIGVVRFDVDINSNKSEVSINLNPKFRGKGYGFKLLSRALELYLVSEKKVATFIAKVKKDNIPSLKIFEKCNFNKSFEDEFFIYLSRNIVF